MKSLSKSITKVMTVVELDLIGYTTICNNIEGILSVAAVTELNSQIQSFVDLGLKAVGVSRKYSVVQSTGDGAILVFEKPEEAHRFSEAVHSAAAKHNRKSKAPLGKRAFRIGAATGEISITPNQQKGFNFAGATIVRAVRLEANALPGGLLADEETLRGLNLKQKNNYGPRSEIQGKRSERYFAFECQMDRDALKVAAAFVDQVQVSNSSLPQLIARFREENGQLCPASNARKPAYWIDLWIANAPKVTKRVAFEILDAGFSDPKWTVERDPQSIREFLTEDMNSYGNVEILYKSLGSTKNAWSMKTSLLNALLGYYKGQTLNGQLRKALKQIRNE